MKIGLCGAGGTGKGTVVRSLVSKMRITPIYSSVEYLGKLIKPDSKSFSDFSDEERALFQYSIVSAEIQNERFLADNNKDYIAERSLFDYLAYWGVNNSIGGYENFEKYVLGAYKKNPYDYLFFIPIEFEAKDTDVSSWKERDQKSRKEREDILLELIFKLHVVRDSTIVILKGSVEDRVNKILSTISLT